MTNIKKVKKEIIEGVLEKEGLESKIVDGKEVRVLNILDNDIIDIPSIYDLEFLRLIAKEGNLDNLDKVLPNFLTNKYDLDKATKQAKKRIRKKIISSLELEDISVENIEEYLKYDEVSFDRLNELFLNKYHYMQVYYSKTKDVIEDKENFEAFKANIIKVVNEDNSKEMALEEIKNYLNQENFISRFLKVNKVSNEAFLNCLEDYNNLKITSYEKETNEVVVSSSLIKEIILNPKGNELKTISIMKIVDILTILKLKKEGKELPIIKVSLEEIDNAITGLPSYESDDIYDDYNIVSKGLRIKDYDFSLEDIEESDKKVFFIPQGVKDNINQSIYTYFNVISTIE